MPIKTYITIETVLFVPLLANTIIPRISVVTGKTKQRTINKKTKE